MALFARAALTASVLFACAACATQFDTKSAGSVRSIAIKPVDEPSIIAATQFVLRADSFKMKGQDFGDLMAAQNLRLGAELRALVAKELDADGYQVIDDPTGSDAVLELEITGFPPVNRPAYAAAAANFEPEFTVSAKLTGAKDKKTLFRRIYVYRDNSISPIDGSLLIRPEQKYAFPSAQALFGHPELAAEGFRAGLSTIAKSVGDSLRKP